MKIRFEIREARPVVQMKWLQRAVPFAIIAFAVTCPNAHAAEPRLPKSRPVIIDLTPASEGEQLRDIEQLPDDEPAELTTDQSAEEPSEVHAEGRAGGPILTAEPDPALLAGPKIPAPRPDRPAPAAPEEPPEPVLQPKPDFDLAQAKQCESELRRLRAAFTVAEPVVGEGQCGWPRPLKLTSLSRKVKIRGDIEVRCEVALALARWSKDVMVPSAKLHLGKVPEAVRIDTSYQCRRRNNAKTGKLSEHAFANGVDLMGFVFPEDQVFNVAVRSGSTNAERAFQAAARGGACAYFTTVIGPMTNAGHADHLHLDLAVRRGGYRLCE